MTAAVAVWYYTLPQEAETNSALAASGTIEATQVALYGPVCVERYMAKATAEQRSAFAKESEWMRDSFIEKSGFATPPGAKEPSGGIADACAAAARRIGAWLATQKPLDRHLAWP